MPAATSPSTPTEPAFARDPATAAYYDQRAAEYDEWYEDRGLFADRARVGWQEDVQSVVAMVGGLPAARTLDIACGTGYLTRHLSGLAVGVDQSPAMVAIAGSRLPAGITLVADALHLPFPGGHFDRVFTGHFYGHLPEAERATFLGEASRVARELIVVDSHARSDRPRTSMQQRTLNDGSQHEVYKRYFEAEQLASELGGEVLLDLTWFVAAVVRF